MSFGWNAWSPVNLGIDLAFLTAAALIVWRQAWPALPDSPARAAVFPLCKGAALSFLPWLVGGAVLGGILGLCLIARVLWTAATVGIPLAILALCWRWRRARLLTLALPLLVLKVYGEAWCPNDLDVQTLRVAVPGLKDRVRLVHLSDLQTDDIRGIHLAAQEAANAFDPDFIAFTGDVLNHESLIPEVTRYLRGFKHRGGAFFVTGNVDGVLPLPAFCRDIGFQCLDEAVQVVEVGSSRVAFLGLGLRHVLDSELLQGLVREAKEADIRVLLSHYPDSMHIARPLPIQLLLAGHTHGGQVCLPWTPIVTLSSVPRRIAAGGLHQVEGLTIHVSRGLGWEGHIAPRVRLFARPHLALLELVPDAPSKFTHFRKSAPDESLEPRGGPRGLGAARPERGPVLCRGPASCLEEFSFHIHRNLTSRARCSGLAPPLARLAGNS